MSNETIFALILVVDLAFILLAFRLGKEWLFGAIIVNIILTTTFASKLIPIFGYVTNAANVFYASIFLATDALTEHYGKKEGYKSVWLGFSTLVIFVVLGQLVLKFVSVNDTIVISEAMRSVFEGVPRIAIASMLAYVIAQNFDIWFYHFIHQKTGGKMLWLRNNLSTLTSQLIDSVVFFPVAFLGILPLSVVIQLVLTGYIFKVVIALFDTPFIYLTYFIKNKKYFPIISKTNTINKELI